MQYVLGIDGGQTSTEAALATLDGEVIRRIDAPAWDTTKSRQGRAKCRAALASIERQIREVVAVGRFAGEVAPGAATGSVTSRRAAQCAIASICIGMTGGSSGRELVARWTKTLFSCDLVTVLPDMVASLRGANPTGGDGVAVVAGGGSVAWGRTRDGREAMAGGYGHILGDAGSAYEIGRQAIVAALMAYQERAPETVLTHEVLEHFGVESIWDARLAVYSGGDAREVVSALAPRVARAALDGDAAAMRIVQQAGTELASMAHSVIERLKAGAARVFPTGGVLAGGTPVRAAFIDALRALSPEAVVLEPALPPLGGALIVALEQAGALNTESMSQVATHF